MKALCVFLLMCSSLLTNPLTDTSEGKAYEILPQMEYPSTYEMDSLILGIPPISTYEATALPPTEKRNTPKRVFTGTEASATGC